MLKKGDKVVMHTCREAMKYRGRIWECEGDEFENPLYRDRTEVKLRGYEKTFKTKYVQKVDIPDGTVVMPLKDEVKNYLFPKELVVDQGKQVILDAVYDCIKHFYRMPEPEQPEIEINYFDNTLNLTIPVPLGMKVVYESKSVEQEDVPLVIQLHDILAGLGVSPKATLEVYFPEVQKIINDCQVHGIPFSTFTGGINYTGERLDIIIKSY